MAKKSKPSQVDLLELSAVMVELLNRLVKELLVCTASSNWRELPKLGGEVRQLKDELDEIVEARRKSKAGPRR